MTQNTPVEFAARRAELQKTVAPPYTVNGPTLTPIGKQFQSMVLARDWDALFTFLPPAQWGQYGMLGKYSFVDEGSARRYIPFTKGELRRFVFSPWYTVQPGWDCTDEQREMGVAALFKSGQSHKAKFAATDWKSIWPIYPGWGYPGQRYGCEKYQPSTWVKIRKPVVIAAAIVSAVYLGPMALAKIKGAASATGSGIVGAGAKAGGAIKAGAAGAAGIVGSAGGAVAAGAGGLSASGLLAGSQRLIGQVNNARTIRAIVRGEIPPPPIGVQGASWREWTLNVAQDEFERDYQRRMTRNEELMMEIEIANMQRELNAIIPRNMPMSPNVSVPAVVQEKSAELAIKENQGQTATVALLAIAGFALILKG